jgi:toxin FitB
MAARWLLDTCVLSEQTRPEPSPAVQAWLGRHLPDCALAAVSFGEIGYGIECLPHGARRNRLAAWAAGLGERFAARTLPSDTQVWSAFGRLKASLHSIGRPQDSLDLLIAATATVHGLTLVTRNIRHFQDTGVNLLNPWEATTT